MKSWPGVSMSSSVVRDSLTGLLFLFFLPFVTHADQGLSLDPNPPLRECDTLTAQWPLAHPNPAHSNLPFYSVAIVDNSSSQTLFQTNVTSPTNSAAWVVNVTEGVLLHLAIHTPPNLDANHYAATDFQVHLGLSTCFPSAVRHFRLRLSLPSHICPGDRYPEQSIPGNNDNDNPTHFVSARFSNLHGPSVLSTVHCFPSELACLPFHCEPEPFPIDTPCHDSQSNSVSRFSGYFSSSFQRRHCSWHLSGAGESCYGSVVDFVLVHQAAPK